MRKKNKKTRKNSITRNFDLSSQSFLQTVLNNHERTASYYNDKMDDVFGTLNVLPSSPAYVIDPTAIHVNEPNTWLMQITYGLEPDAANTDISIGWVEWPINDPDPAPVDGTVHFSVPLIYALYSIYQARILKFTKAKEYVDGKNIVAIAFKAFDLDGNLVYIGNLTNQLPMFSSTLP